MKTQKGRVVYNRKVHMFRWKDVSRIEKALKEQSTLEKWVTDAINAFQISAEVIEEDFIEAFKYSLKAFWEWVKNPQVNPETFAESRGFAQTLEKLKAKALEPEEYSWDIKQYGAAMTAIMINIIEEIQQEVK